LQFLLEARRSLAEATGDRRAESRKRFPGRFAVQPSLEIEKLFVERPRPFPAGDIRIVAHYDGLDCHPSQRTDHGGRQGGAATGYEPPLRITDRAGKPHRRLGKL